tara:strand:+ start:8993 stop:9916 length:924 start_codon:yes stop_codon:yes gene_type:complete
MTNNQSNSLYEMIKRLFHFLKLFLTNLIWSDRIYISRKYLQKVGVKLNLKNPKTFTSKIQWLKLNDKNPIYSKCADKYLVRDFVEKKIGKKYLIPLITSSKNADKINFNKLPKKYIIKCNHGSGMNIIVKNNKMNKFDEWEDFDEKKIKKILKAWMRKNFYHINREWEYKNITRRVVIEELIYDESGNDGLNDYKFHCFNGKPMYIQTFFNRIEGVKENWFDTKWNLIDLYYLSSVKADVKKPKNLNQLLQIAKKLSEEFNYVRVDLYTTNNNIYFGELTFRPYGGFMNFVSKRWDKILGDLLNLKR